MIGFHPDLSIVRSPWPRRCGFAALALLAAMYAIVVAALLGALL